MMKANVFRGVGGGDGKNNPAASAHIVISAARVSIASVQVELPHFDA